MSGAGEPRAGGCQCGAIRFRIVGAIDHTSLCHCRMCQKATGGMFGAFATVRNSDLVWTRGAPAYFRSSSLASRGYCPDCGTPLTFVWDERTTSITFGAFDDPRVLTVDFALDAENAHPALASLPHVRQRPIAKTDVEKSAYATLENFQHPDHDTSTWP